MEIINFIFNDRPHERRGESWRSFHRGDGAAWEKEEERRRAASLKRLGFHRVETARKQK